MHFFLSLFKTIYSSLMNVTSLFNTRYNCYKHSKNEFLSSMYTTSKILSISIECKNE